MYIVFFDDKEKVKYSEIFTDESSFTHIYNKIKKGEGASNINVYRLGEDAMGGDELFLDKIEVRKSICDFDSLKLVVKDIIDDFITDVEVDNITKDMMIHDMHDFMIDNCCSTISRIYHCMSVIAEFIFEITGLELSDKSSKLIFNRLQSLLDTQEMELIY